MTTPQKERRPRRSCNYKQGLGPYQTKTGTNMNAITPPDTWTISNNVTVTEKEGVPVVLITADSPLNKSQTRRLVRDLLEAQRFISEFLEPIPYLPV